MTFDSSVFWPALKRAGMLTEVSYQDEPFDAKFQRPDQVVLDGVVHATDYRIEYQAADVTLARGATLVIGADSYKVNAAPQAKGDGTFVVATLEKL